MVYGYGYSQDYKIQEHYIKYENQTYTHSDIFLDRDGFRWYTTRNGIIKDYGVSKIYIPLHPLAKEAAQDYDIEEDGLGNIWVGNISGGYIVDPVSYEVKALTWHPSNSQENEHFMSLKKGPNNSMYIITDKGNLLQAYANGTIEWMGATHLITDPHWISFLGNDPEKLLFWQDESLYLWENDTLLSLYDKTKGLLPPNWVLIDKLPSGIPPKRSGHFYYESTPFEYHYLPKIDQYLFTIPFYGVRGLIDDTEYVFMENKDELIVTKFASESNTLVLQKDKTIPIEEGFEVMTPHPSENKMYLSYSTKYVSIMFYRRFTQHLLSKQLHAKDISTRNIISDSLGSIYAATYQGIYKIDTTGKEGKLNNDLGGIRFFIWENDSTFFAATDGESLFRVKSRDGSRDPLEFEPPFSNFQFTTIFKDTLSNYLLGANKGMFTYNLTTQEVKKWQPPDPLYSLEERTIHDLLKTNNQVWVATNNGLYKFDPKKQESFHYTEKQGLLSNDIYDIHLDTNHLLWLATNKGINSLDSLGNISSYTLADGISDNNICNILETDDDLWFSTYSGITLIEKESKKVSILEISDEDGQKTEFNRWSAHKFNDSILLFGSITGIYSFNTLIKKNHKEDPQLKLTSITTFNKDLEKAEKNWSNLSGIKTLELGHRNNTFTAEVALTNTHNIKNATYLYTIDGLMDDWINQGNNHAIVINAMPSGSYTLRIRGRNDSGVLSSNEISIPISVAPVFYKSIWFIIATILFFVGITLFFAYQYNRRKTLAAANETKLRELEKKALVAQMNPHFLFNTLNGIQNAILRKSEREVNRHISAFSKLLRTSLNMSFEGTISLKEEIAFLHSYLQLQQEKLLGGFHYSITVDEPESISYIFIPSLMIQPLVENAILHGLMHKKGERELNIHFQVFPDLVVGTISDNGIGRKNSEKLNLSSKRLYKSKSTAIMTKRISVLNQMGKDHKLGYSIEDLNPNDEFPGTKVIITIPIKPYSKE